MVTPRGTFSVFPRVYFVMTRRFAPARYVRWGLHASLILLFGFAAAGNPLEQSDDALKTKVAELVKELDASKATARQSAQEKLIQLGADALPLLPAPDAKGLSAEQKRRLGEIRTALGNSSGKLPLAGSQITL